MGLNRYQLSLLCAVAPHALTKMEDEGGFSTTMGTMLKVSAALGVPAVTVFPVLGSLPLPEPLTRAAVLDDVAEESPD